MKHYFLIISALLLFSISVNAAELKLDGFSFQFPGNWKVDNNENGSKSAIFDSNGKKKEFELTVLHPTTEEETIGFLENIQDYIGNIYQVNNSLKIVQNFSEYKTKSGAPFMYIVYSGKNSDEFFIGSSLGSTSGILMITFAGIGGHVDAVAEFKGIIETMSID